MQPPRVYHEDPAFTMPRKFLDEEIYKVALESFVVLNVDVLFIDKANKNVYLAKRIIRPMLGFWMIGGRMHAGEDATEAIRRCVKRETSLDLDLDRFRFLTLLRYIWRTRAQEPYDKGSDNLCYTFTAELSPEERAAVAQHLDRTEYDSEVGLQEFDLAALKAHGSHQALIDIYRTIFDDA